MVIDTACLTDGHPQGWTLRAIFLGRLRDGLLSLTQRQRN